MDLAETAEQRRLRQELRTFFAELLPEEERRQVGEEGVGGDRFREVVRMLGESGWLGIGWPVEYGGQGRSMEEQFVFFDEVQRAGLPFPFVTVNTVGPTLMEFGTEEQKRAFLPGILAGEIVFAIGYTEPDAGTDLASLATRAVPVEGDGGEPGFVVDGQKVFTSGANTADYVWLACRTDPDAPKHRGISILIVPTDDPGFSWSPIHTVGGMMTTATFYDGVRVPRAHLVGELHRGWSLITSQLNHERIGLAAQGGRTIALWEEARDWAVASGAAEDPLVRAELARLYALLEAMRLVNQRMVAAVSDGTLSGADAGAAKVFGTEVHLEVHRSLSEMLGPDARVRPPVHGAADVAADLEQQARQGLVYTFGGGVNDVLRDMVATKSLGLPHSRVR